MKLGCLNERAVICKGWRWMPGMLTMDGVRIYAVDGDTFDGFDDDSEYNDHPVSALEWPDLTDPATLGCLLALVRKAFPGCHAEPNGAPEWDGYDEEERSNWWAVFSCGPHRLMATGATEAEALVAALEAAP